MKSIGIISLALAASAVAFADGNNASTYTGSAVTVVSPIKVTRLSDLNFGTLVVDTDHFTPGGISVGSDGKLNGTALGHGTWLFTGTGHATPSAAVFSVTGMEGYPFGLIARPFVIALKDGSQMTIVPNIVHVDGSYGTASTKVAIGGQLGLLNGKPGVWSGTFNVTAFYM